MPYIEFMGVESITGTYSIVLVAILKIRLMREEKHTMIHYQDVSRSQKRNIFAQACFMKQVCMGHSLKGYSMDMFKEGDLKDHKKASYV